MTKSKWFFLGVVAAALLAIGGGMAWGADLPTQAEVWGTIHSEGFGPSIMGYFWNDYTAIEDAYISDDGRYFFVVYRTPSMAVKLNGDAYPDSIWRDVFGVKDGRIVMLGQQGARVTPEKVEPESYEFSPWE